ncbi:MAG: Calx-beta domain-containing protein [Sphingomonadales bacterium]
MIYFSDFRLSKSFSLLATFGLILLLASSPSLSATVDYEYDELGRLISVTYSDGTTIDYAYDDAGNRTSIVEDDSGLAYPVEFMVEGGAAFEGENITFTVTKIGTSTGTLSVSYATAGDTAIQGTDYTGKSGTLNFPASSTVDSQTVNVVTTSDAIQEELEKFFMDLSNPSTGSIVSVPQATGNLLNVDDPPPPPPPNNSPPVGGHADYHGDRGTTATVNIKGTDPDGDPLIATEVTQQPSGPGGGGSVTISSDGKKLVLFFSGIDGIAYDFAYTIEDTSGATATSTGTLNPHDPGGGQ